MGGRFQGLFSQFLDPFEDLIIETFENLFAPLLRFNLLFTQKWRLEFFLSLFLEKMIYLDTYKMI